MSITTTSRGRAVPTPQLREEFEAATLLDLEPDVVTGNIALSTTGPKFGSQCAVVQSNLGHRLHFADTQLPIRDVTRFQLGIWVRNDTPPPDTFGYTVWLQLGTILGLDVELRIRPAEATPGTNDRFQWWLGGAFGPSFALPAAWRYLEAQGYRDAAGTWTLATRLHGVNQDTRSVPGLGVIPEITTLLLNYPAAPPSPGFVAGLDRWWFWAGTSDDPRPQWWSSVAGWDGTSTLQGVRGDLQPGLSGSLVSGPTTDLI